ncbi:MAG: DUF1294 domain-containing protein [Gemmataceae bacterium]
MPASYQKRPHPLIFHASVAGLLVLLTSVVIWNGPLGQSESRWAWLAAWLFAINLGALLYYGYDKWQARRGGRRVPENVLHALALGGGSPGAYLAMRLFRHKTVKGGFRIVFWLIVLAQAALLVWVSGRL